tara:strand:- start:1866 stop:2552 length:687 start_codon:yes stop_codon:yes gene_type:complete
VLHSNINNNIEKDELIEAILKHVPFEGWTQKAILAGAEDIKLDKNKAICIFPGQAIDLLEYHSNLADRRMVEAIKELDLDKMKIREKVKASIQIRLGAAKFHKEALRAGIPTLAAPSNALTALRLLYDTVDNIWFAIGDSSVDFNFYTKRTLLGNVYLITFLFWLSDKSDSDSNTWNFLDRRIEEIMRVQILKTNLSSKNNPMNEMLGTIKRLMKYNHWDFSEISKNR